MGLESTMIDENTKNIVKEMKKELNLLGTIKGGELKEMVDKFKRETLDKEKPKHYNEVKHKKL